MREALLKDRRDAEEQRTKKATWMAAFDKAQAERDEARAEVERLKAELEAAKAQARYYRHLHDFETCTGCNDPDCGLCGSLNQ